MKDGIEVYVNGLEWDKKRFRVYIFWDIKNISFKKMFVKLNELYLFFKSILVEINFKYNN